MSNPRFQPNSFTDEPLAFGKAQVIQWKDVPSYEADRLLAAQIQHRLACVISKQARTKYGSLRAYSETADLNYDRLVKVLRGEHIMRLEDVAAAERHVGHILADTFSVPFVPVAEPASGQTPLPTHIPHIDGDHA